MGGVATKPKTLRTDLVHRLNMRIL